MQHPWISSLNVLKDILSIFCCPGTCSLLLLLYSSRFSSFPLSAIIVWVESSHKLFLNSRRRGEHNSTSSFVFKTFPCSSAIKFLKVNAMWATFHSFGTSLVNINLLKCVLMIRGNFSVPCLNRHDSLRNFVQFSLLIFHESPWPLEIPFCAFHEQYDHCRITVPYPLELEISWIPLPRFIRRFNKASWDGLHDFFPTFP